MYAAVATAVVARDPIRRRWHHCPLPTLLHKTALKGKGGGPTLDADDSVGSRKRKRLAR